MQNSTQVTVVCLAIAIFLGACSSDVPKPSFVSTGDVLGWDLPSAGDSADGRVTSELVADLDAVSGGEVVPDVAGDGGASDGLLVDLLPADVGGLDVADDVVELDVGKDLIDVVPPDAGPLDSDGDGVPDAEDNCPFVPSADHTDTDMDGQGDVCDEDDDNDGFDDEDDCGPLDATVNPAGVEVCDDLDNDCDGDVDEDPFFECGSLGVCADGVTTKCVDGQAVCDVGALETWCSYDLCDGLDNDCDGDIDEADFEICCDCDWDNGPPAWYTICDPGAANPDDDGDGVLDGADNCPQAVNPGQEDFDTDGFGDACDVDDDNDGSLDGADCEPLNAAVFPGAIEICNGLDDNCDGVLDEGASSLTCGKGVCTNTVLECINGIPQDCAPLDMAMDEVCDLLDNDCDGEVDEELANVTCGQGACFTILPGCVAGQVPVCVPEDNAAEEVCDGLDNDCDGEVDEGLGTATCGTGPCEHTIELCKNGATQDCVPLPPPAGSCNAEPAPCKTTTTGVDACGNVCSKVGPAQCYTVHKACLTSNPGSPTDATQCTTPKGNYNCGLTCQEWPNTIGADCTYCVNIFCQQASGLDKAQFKCNNPSMPPTP